MLKGGRGVASPQKENGFTAIAHEILEAIQHFKFTLNELKIILCVFRYTYGFNRKTHSMSLSFFEKHTGLSRSRINKALKNLVDNNVLIITKKGDVKTPNEYMFNKDYDSWTIEKYSSFSGVELVTSVQDDTSAVTDTSTSVQADTSTSVQSGTRGSVQNGTQEIYNIYTTTTTTNTPEPIAFFEENLCRLSPIQMQELIFWEEEFNGRKEILNEAIRIADNRNRRNFGFVKTLLQEWKDNGLKTLHDVRVYESNKFKNNKWRSNNNFETKRTDIPPKKEIDFSEGEDWN